MRLNHHGRPWGVPREHVNRWGVAKAAMTREVAIGKALTLSHERALDPERRDRGHVEAYQCGHCGSWHIGTPIRARKRGLLSALAYELGERALFNLPPENHGRPEKRLAAIRARCRRVLREAA
jgi:hypothetical protein